MDKIIAIEQEESRWVADRVVSSTWITKGSINYTLKALWILVHHILIPIYGDNVMSPNRASLIVGIMEIYEPNIAKWKEDSQ